MSFSTITLGDKAPDIIRVVIEIPRGSTNKYEYDEELDEITLDRVIHSPFFYPTEYGFVPGTRSEDGDMLDIMVVTTYPTFPGCVLTARPVGVLDMKDEEGIDPKILAVAHKDPHFKEVSDLSGVNDHLKQEIGHFFSAYKHLEGGKWAEVNGWRDADVAKAMIEDAKKRFETEK